MNCEEARLQIGAEPTSSSPALEEHLRLCQACREFLREMTALELDIRRALERPPVLLRPVRAPQRAGNDVSRFATRARERWWARFSASRRWAVAASILMTFAVGVLLWGLYPAETLAEDVIKHLAGEPASWSSTERQPQSAVDYTLRHAGVSLDVATTDVVYAMGCWFRGRYVPHLVVRTQRGSFTVLVLQDERVRARARFEDAGYTGVLLPASRGAIAVVSLGPVAPEAMDEAARKIFTALSWTSQA